MKLYDITPAYVFDPTKRTTLEKIETYIDDNGKYKSVYYLKDLILDERVDSEAYKKYMVMVSTHGYPIKYNKDNGHTTITTDKGVYPIRDIIPIQWYWKYRYLLQDSIKVVFNYVSKAPYSHITPEQPKAYYVHYDIDGNEIIVDKESK